MVIQFDPQYFMGYLSMEEESNWVAPTNPAATAGAAAPVFRPVIESFRKKARKQTMRSAKEQEEYLNRAFDKRQADRKKREKKAARVAKQQAAAAAVASQNWQQVHKEAADVRNDRQKAVAQRQAARAHMAEARQATRAISKAAAMKKAPVDAPVLQAEQQGPAPLPCLARAPKAAGQRGRNSGWPAEEGCPDEEAHQEGAPTWRTGRIQPYSGQQLCNACSIWEGCKGSLSRSVDKVGKYREAFLAQQAQQAQGSEAFGGGGAMSNVRVERQATEGPVAAEQQGSTAQLNSAGDGDSAQPTQAAAASAAAAAAAPAAAVAAPDAVQQQKCSRRNRTQHVQQADIPAGDAGSGTTETGPQAKRKRSAADTNVQQVQPKRAKADCRGRHGAELHEASTVGQGVMPVAPAAGTQGQKDDGLTSLGTFDRFSRRHHRIIANYTQQQACAIVGVDGLIHSAQADHCSDGCAACMDDLCSGPSDPNLD